MKMNLTALVNIFQPLYLNLIFLSTYIWHVMKTASYRLPKRYKNSVSSYAHIITSYYSCFTIEENIIHFRIVYRPLNTFCDDFKFTFFLNED